MAVDQNRRRVRVEPISTAGQNNSNGILVLSFDLHFKTRGSHIRAVLKPFW